ncbi:MAG TPA: type VI secretion system contractile sheath small subunit, partial [Pirellulales bacterium]|nr:type VI secretion system contractile sheath small subunit [Pirellulales bacterium]
PKKESTQHKLDRIRRPRVQITYDVEVGDAMEVRELPFVMGILGDFSGKIDPDTPLPPLKDRKFLEIDRDNFDKVLAGMNPRLAFRVDDKLTGKEGNQVNVELKFKSLDDFAPENVVNQVEPLKKLLETRGKLKDLLSKMDGNDKLEALLEDIVKNSGSREELSKALGLDGQDSPE